MILCDGSFPGGDPCTSKFCFTCAGVKSVPAGDFYCGLCNGKRASPDAGFTPTRSKQKKTVTLSPDLREKVETSLRKDKLPEFPVSDNGSGVSGQSGGGVNDALILNKLIGIESTLTQMVTVSQLSSLKADLIHEFEKSIQKLQAQLTALNEENKDLKRRVSELEELLKSVPNVMKQPDNAFKRLSFIGFPIDTSLERLDFMKTWMTTNFPGITFSSGNIMRGPMKARVLTAVCFVEFIDSDVRNAVLSSIGSRQLKCSYKEKVINIKPALS